MPTELDEEYQKFTFDDSWTVFRYDSAEAGYHGIRDCMPGTKSCDFLGVWDGRGVPIEVKDFRGYRIRNKSRITDGKLVVEVAFAPSPMANHQNNLRGCTQARSGVRCGSKEPCRDGFPVAPCRIAPLRFVAPTRKRRAASSRASRSIETPAARYRVRAPRRFTGHRWESGSLRSCRTEAIAQCAADLLIRTLFFSLASVVRDTL